MAKLIVEEGGGRRSFRMGKGVLSVGSGAEARLRLTSPAVAEIHFDLVLGEQGVLLRPRPGVQPPRVNGVPASGDVALVPGRAVEVGGARLWIEAEEGAAPAARPAPTPAAVPAPAPGAPPALQRGPRRAARGHAERPGRVPSWLIVVGFLAVTGLALALWFRLVSGKAEDSTGMATNLMRSAEQAAATGHFDEARSKLAQIPASALTPELGRRAEELRQRFGERDTEVALALENEVGTRYLDTLLRKYEGRYLQGQPEPAKVRLFLKRARTFRERWPRHPELDWVSRQEARFAGFVDPNAPPTWADVQWEVKDLTDGMPRNYVAALALIDEFLGRASGGEATEAQGLRDKLVGERPEYARDRLYQAKHEYEKNADVNKAVWWLVHSVAWLGDEALADESARFLVLIPDLAGHLLGYKANYPDRYTAVMKNAVVARWASDNAFEP